MNYSLGNMLVNGGSLNPDGLALDLQFAADKTLTARKGPTPVFTRASTATFIGSNGLIQSAAINTPRFDHDPTTLASLGLLIEESRTNLVFPSDTLSTQTRTVTATPHTLSFYGTGTIVLSGVHVATVVGTGAYPTRTTLTFTPTAGSLTLTVTGSVTQAQLEVGSFPTSYIPTTTASVARSADVCSITGGAFSGIYNQSEGTIASDTVIANLTGNNRGTVTIDDGTSNSHIRHNYAISNGGFTTTIKANDTETILGSFAGVASVVQKRATAYSGTSFVGVANGGSPVPATRAMPIGLSAMRIGAVVSGALFLSGHVSSVRYYKKRLSNSKLQSLTT